MDELHLQATRRARRVSFGVGLGVLFVVGSVIGVSAFVTDGGSPDEARDTLSQAEPRERAANAVAGSSRAAPGPVSATFGSSAALKHNFETIEELATAPEVEAIVIGKISNVSYESQEGWAKTVLTVEVSKALHGTTMSTVVASEDGGFLRASEVMAEIAEKYPELDQKIDPQSYVDMIFEGAAHPRVGEEVLLFLWHDPNPGHEGDFMEIGSVYGRFTRGSDGQFHRAGDTTGMEPTVSLSELEAMLHKR